MARILVLGAGFGGIPCALELRRRLPKEHTVTLLDPRDTFVMGLAKLWALDGRRHMEKGRRPLAALETKGVRFVQAAAERIDLSERTVTARDATHPWDRLVIAMGARLAPEATADADAAHNLYDPAGVQAFAHDLATIEKGRLLVAIGAMPFKCPPAPYEAAMIADAVLRKRGVRDQVSVTLTTPEPKPLPIAPADCSADLGKHLEERHIEYAPNAKPDRFDAKAKEVHYADGSTRSFDLAAFVPVHQAPKVLEEVGLLGPTGWVPVDRETLATKHEHVWAIGDSNGILTPSGKPLPKAGVFAEAQGQVVAANVAAELLGEDPKTRFDGHGFCYIELGDGTATAIEGNFFASPAPTLTLRKASAAHVEEKKRFEAERLREWFGG